MTSIRLVVIARGSLLLKLAKHEFDLRFIRFKFKLPVIYLYDMPSFYICRGNLRKKKRLIVLWLTKLYVSMMSIDL